MVVGPTGEVFVGVRMGEDDGQGARCLVAVTGRL